MRGCESAPHEPLDDLRRHRSRFQPCWIVRVTADQHAGLGRLDGELLALENVVDHLEAGSLETLDPAFDFLIQSPCVEGMWNFARVSTMGMPTRPYL